MWIGFEACEASYNKLKESGMLWEFYPDASGDFITDCVEVKDGEEKPTVDFNTGTPCEWEEHVGDGADREES